jgi:hypothetical protein
MQVLEELITENYPDQVNYWLGNTEAANHTSITLGLICPECGGKRMETVSQKAELSQLLALKCRRCQIRERNGNLHLNIPLPFGKHFGKTINDVMEEDPSYLVWFAKNVVNMRDLVEQIKSHSQFPNAWAAYMNKERRRKAREERY